MSDLKASQRTAHAAAVPGGADASCDAARPTLHALRAVLPIFLVSRLGVLAAGYFAIAAFGYAAGEPRVRLYPDELRNLPFRYDVGWYLAIASEGYRWDPAHAGQQSIAFFPALPLTARVVGSTLHVSFLPAAMGLALGATLAALIYLFRLARSYMSADRSAAAVWLLAAYPFAVFYSVPYTEPLFLASMLGAWVHLRRGESWRAMAWGIAAGLTRPNGALLSIALALLVVERLRQQRPEAGRRWHALARALLPASGPTVGMLMHSAYVWRLTGYAFTWVSVQTAWNRQFTSPLRFLVEWVGTIGYFDDAVGAIAMIDFAAGSLALLMLGLTWPVAKRFGAATAVLIPVLLLPVMLSGGFQSLGRSTSVIFPAFLWMGAALPETQRSTWIAAFAMGQALAAAMFFTWRPLF